MTHRPAQIGEVVATDNNQDAIERNYNGGISNVETDGTIRKHPTGPVRVLLPGKENPIKRCPFFGNSPGVGGKVLTGKADGEEQKPWCMSLSEQKDARATPVFSYDGWHTKSKTGGGDRHIPLISTITQVDYTPESAMDELTFKKWDEDANEYVEFTFDNIYNVLTEDPFYYIVGNSTDDGIGIWAFSAAADDENVWQSRAWFSSTVKYHEDESDELEITISGFLDDSVIIRNRSIYTYGEATIDGNIATVLVRMNINDGVVDYNVIFYADVPDSTRHYNEFVDTGDIKLHRANSHIFVIYTEYKRGPYGLIDWSNNNYGYPLLNDQVNVWLHKFNYNMNGDSRVSIYNANTEHIMWNYKKSNIQTGSWNYDPYLYFGGGWGDTHNDPPRREWLVVTDGDYVVIAPKLAVYLRVAEFGNQFHMRSNLPHLVRYNSWGGFTADPQWDLFDPPLEWFGYESGIDQRVEEELQDDNDCFHIQCFKIADLSKKWEKYGTDSSISTMRIARIPIIAKDGKVFLNKIRFAESIQAALAEYDFLIDSTKRPVTAFDFGSYLDYGFLGSYPATTPDHPQDQIRVLSGLSSDIECVNMENGETLWLYSLQNERVGSCVWDSQASANFSASINIPNVTASDSSSQHMSVSHDLPYMFDGSQLHYYGLFNAFIEPTSNMLIIPIDSNRHFHLYGDSANDGGTYNESNGDTYENWEVRKALINPWGVGLSEITGGFQVSASFTPIPEIPEDLPDQEYVPPGPGKYMHSTDPKYIGWSDREVVQILVDTSNTEIDPTVSVVGSITSKLDPQLDFIDYITVYPEYQTGPHTLGNGATASISEYGYVARDRWRPDANYKVLGFPGPYSMTNVCSVNISNSSPGWYQTYYGNFNWNTTYSGNEGYKPILDSFNESPMKFLVIDIINGTKVREISIPNTNENLDFSVKFVGIGHYMAVMAIERKDIGIGYKYYPDYYWYDVFDGTKVGEFLHTNPNNQWKTSGTANLDNMVSDGKNIFVFGNDDDKLYRLR